MVYEYTESAIKSLGWSVAHHSTVSFEGVHVKLPLMWRQDEELPGGVKSTWLVRSEWGKSFPTERIVIYKNSPPVQQPLMQRFEIVATKSGQPEFRGQLISLDQELAGRFTCIAPRLEKVPDWQIACDSNDGRWSVQYIAREPDIKAFMTVLRNIVSPHG
jgi:hypothetical protein